MKSSRLRWLVSLVGFLLAFLFLVSCQSSARAEVVIYTSVDQPYAEPILKAFEEQYGIRVLAVYDVEAAKTTGLVNRLVAEKASPQADVFWNSEILQTLLLKKEDVLAPYFSPQAEILASAFRDPAGYWAGVGGRARVLIVNTQRLTDSSQVDSLSDLIDPAWTGSDKGIAYPLFGTTATHAAVLYASWGAEDARQFFLQVASQNVRLLDGNSVVRDLVASGNLAFGLTDSDDACAALSAGAPVKVLLPDQDGEGTLLIPGSVALIEGAPHPEQAKMLIDYLLSAQVAQALVDSGFNHLPIHPQVKPVEACLGSEPARLMEVDFARAYAVFEQTQVELREIFVR